MADITLISGSTGRRRIRRGTSGGKAGSCRFFNRNGARSVIRGSVNFRDLADNQLNARCRRHSGQPDPFYEDLQTQKPDLSAVRFGAIGIGSREYDTFCGAIEKIEAELKGAGAKQVGETLKINILEHEIPEDPAEIWLGSWINLLK